MTMHYRGASIEGALELWLQGAVFAAAFTLFGGKDRGLLGHGELWLQSPINQSLLVNKDIR